MNLLSGRDISASLVLSEVFDFIQRLIQDSRLRPVHLAVATTLIKNWVQQSGNRAFHISRKSAMKHSGIRSAVTYHRVIRDLEEFGYIRYEPSYHPKKGSLVEILKPNAS